MSYIFDDSDYYEQVIVSRPCTACDSGLRKCVGLCNGYLITEKRRRSDEEVAAIQAKRQLEHEEKILAEAACILNRRKVAVEHDPNS